LDICEVRYLLIIFLVFSADLIQAQDSVVAQRDSMLIRDRLRADAVRKDSLAREAARQDSVLKARAFKPDTMVYAKNPFLQFTRPVKMPVSIRQWNGKEGVFYSIMALLLFFAFIRSAFYRYLQDLFRSFFRTSIKQRQIKEQLLQSPLPSLLMNMFFMLCGALFITIVLQNLGLAKKFNFWMLFLYSVIGLGLIYLLKFISLKILGWIFQVSESTDAYIFIVFTTNKIIGIALLPLVMILAFAQGTAYQAALTLAMILIGACFAYRYFLAYSSVQRHIQINIFHFLLYLAAFEIVPVVLINKLLFQFLA
jgi:hypothetical protein